MITASKINPVTAPMMRCLERSLDTSRLQTGQLVAFHDTFAPQQRQRKIFTFIGLVSLIQLGICSMYASLF
jgi:hypothetical protein